MRYQLVRIAVRTGMVASLATGLIVSTRASGLASSVPALASTLTATHSSVQTVTQQTGPTFSSIPLTTHAPNVYVRVLLPVSKYANNPLRDFLLGAHYHAGCPVATCGDWIFGYVSPTVSFKPQAGEYFVYGRGSRRYTFPAGSSLASCTVEVYYGTVTPESNVTVCGQAHGELIEADTWLYHS